MLSLLLGQTCSLTLLKLNRIVRVAMLLGQLTCIKLQ